MSPRTTMRPPAPATGAAPRTWASRLIEIVRFGEDVGVARKGNPYLVLCADERARERALEMDGADVVALLDRLRYLPGTPEAERERARAVLAGVVTRFLDVGAPAADVQIDLVLSAKEIAALPFEAAAGAEGEPLLVRERPVVEISRRVRGAFKNRVTRWPAKPHVLFAAAAPTRGVPAAEHAQALRKALEPWIAPLEGVPGTAPPERGVLTILDRASLRSIREACAAAKPPFTHVHLLAHGCPVGEDGEGYGIELHADAGDGAAPAPAEALAEALHAARTPPSVVTVTACDSANVGSTTAPSASVAHALHASGIPVVLGSQFPLTIPGSTLAVQRFYGGLLKGEDVRTAIHGTRVALHDERAETFHDWMSLAAYVQLPEGYGERLEDVRLASELAALGTAQAWADSLGERTDVPPEEYEKVAERLSERIASLEEWADAPRDSRERHAIDENRGLLGSAHKRLAETLFRRGLRGDARRCNRESRAELEEALRWYAAGFRENLSAHWLGVQQLSLEAVLHGKIPRPWQWHAALVAAEVACEDPKEFWAAGSRAELHLLAPCAGEARQLAKAVDALKVLERRAPRHDRFPLESTARQLRRYVEWWTRAAGFFPRAKDLAADAKRVIRDAGCERWIR